MKTDYPELEGKEVIYNNGYEYIKAKVSGCNYHIGVTIEALDGQYLVCLNGAHSPLYKYLEDPMPKSLYRKFFHELVRQIKNGYINPSILMSIFNITSSEAPTASDCPFAQ